MSAAPGHATARSATRALALRVALATAAAYAVVGWLALRLAVPPDYASPLYPSAGIALAATITYGRAALPGVWLGAFAVSAGLGVARSPPGAGLQLLLLLPLLVSLGATLQAAVGAALVRRFVGHPVVLNSPRDILRFGVLGALVACMVSASVASAALLAIGIITPASGFSTWLTWWVGDTLGVLITAPLVLTLIGRPRGDWRPRRRTLGAPLLLALALLAAAMVELNRLEADRLRASFERDADRLAAEAQSRLQVPLYALQALHSAARAQGGLDQRALAEASRWWLEPALHLQAMGYSVRVARESVAAFEAAARADGWPGYRVFDRAGGSATAADGEVVAVRQIEPRQGNAAALGVNVLSVPAARGALLAARRSGEPTASAGFRLTQSSSDEVGIVLYQALYEGPAGDEATRQARFRGVVFVSVRVEHTLTDLARPRAQYLRWCVIDPNPASGSPRQRIAGAPGCEVAMPGAGIMTVRRLQLADRSLEMHLAAAVASVPGQQPESAWLLSLAGMSAAAMLGALLLTVTGHSRRTELAVQAGTAELRREIDERKQTQKALRDSEARLRSILDHVPIGVMFLHPNGTLIEANPRLCAMLGQTAAQLRGRSVAEISHPDEAAANRRARRLLLAGRGGTAPRQMRLLSADGRVLWVQVSTTALRDTQGRVLRMVGVMEDITERLRLEESERALHRAEASSRAKSEFVSRMSHELRTPLNAMIGFAQLLGLDREPGLNPRQSEWTAQIQRAGWHLLEMINETLDLARIESGAVHLALKPVALAPLVAASQALVSALATQRRVVMLESLSPAVPAVLADATRLKQVLTNLLSNAVKYNHDGGTVTVATRAGAPGQVEVVVADTGLGMSPQQLAALFQPYNRLGREASGVEGTGIGLVISRRLAELMGGTLVASSSAGHGSVFTLRLPAAVSDETAPPAAADTGPAPYQRRRVHYVEDNETNVEVMRGILAQRPQVELGVSMIGLDGLAAVRQQRPDLILLDMQLPDISGLELLRHLKQDDDAATIPVIVVSADATTERMQEALTLGAAHYVTKPLDVARFLALLDEVLESLDTRWGV